MSNMDTCVEFPTLARRRQTDRNDIGFLWKVVREVNAEMLRLSLFAARPPATSTQGKINSALPPTHSKSN